MTNFIDSDQQDSSIPQSGEVQAQVRSRQTDDPQIVVTGQVKESKRGEVIVFEIPLGFFRLICIVPIPDEESDRAPVYVKFKVSRSTKA